MKSVLYVAMVLRRTAAPLKLLQHRSHHFRCLARCTPHLWGAATLRQTQRQDGMHRCIRHQKKGTCALVTWLCFCTVLLAIILVDRAAMQHMLRLPPHCIPHTDLGSRPPAVWPPEGNEHICPASLSACSARPLLLHPSMQRLSGATPWQALHHSSSQSRVAACRRQGPLHGGEAGSTCQPDAGTARRGARSSNVLIGARHRPRLAARSRNARKLTPKHC